MEQESHCSWEAALNFVVLLLVRGTTPLMMYFSMHYLHSAALIVALKCEISLILFTLSAICLLRNSATKTTILKNLQQKSTYWKLLVLGFFQSAAPYFLVAYSIQYIPITLVSVFTVATPWWIFLVERLLQRRDNERIRHVRKVGMAVGIVGIIIMVIPTITESVHCSAKDKLILNNTNNSKSLQEDTPVLGARRDYCHPLNDVVIGVVCMALAPLSWAIATTFWKRNQGDIHYVVSNIGRNASGGVISTLVFIIFGIVYDFGPINWGATQWMIYVAYLGVATGWLGTLLVQNLFSKLGPRLTNQVLTAMPLIAFTEDCLFVRRDTFSMVSKFYFTFTAELVGLLFVTFGLFVSHVPDDVKCNGRKYERIGESVTERLLPSPEHSGYPSDGILEEPLNQYIRNQQYEYERNEYEGGDNYSDEDTMRGPILVPLDTEDVRYLIEAPVL